jgi:Aminoglycoside-2''-adenylyltransferase
MPGFFTCTCCARARSIAQHGRRLHQQFSFEDQRLSIQTLKELADVVGRLMGEFSAPWCVAGGWALDLFVGRVTRPHADVELAIFRDDQASLHSHLSGWTFEKIVQGRREPWRADEVLTLPVHEIHGRSSGELSCAIEFLLNERDAENWTFRRDARISLPLKRAIVRGAGGVPILAPEIVLLFKAKSPRPKDEADFRDASEALDASRFAWLTGALETCHPGHPWTEICRRRAKDVKLSRP